MDEYLEIQELSKRGLSRSEIAQRLGINRHTVGKYLKAATGPPISKPRTPREKILEPYEEYLRKRLTQGCTNAMVLLRELRPQGYIGSYSSLKKYIRPLRQEERWRVELRWESPPGQYAQVDWGYFTAQLPDHSLVRLYAFVFTLAYSRVTYVEWTNRMDLITFERCHEHAFDYVGGVPDYIVYDRMKTVVLNDDKNGQVRFNPAFVDFAGYYGFAPKACPPYWPRGKGKVESGVKYVRYNFWQGLISVSGIDDINYRCRKWLDTVANVRTHGTTGKIPFELIKDEGLKSALGRAPYPAQPAVLRTVSRDCLVSYCGCRYSLPSEWAGKSVWVRAVSGNRLIISAKGQIISDQPMELTLKRTVINEAHYIELRGRPRLKPVRVIPRIESPMFEVERRPLAEYAALVEVK